MLRAGGAGDGLVHEGSAEVVAAGLERRGDAVVAKLHPGALDIWDQGGEHEPRHGMGQERFPESGPAPSPAL